MRSVRIEWVGPFSIEEVLELGDKNKDYGLYQIYGHHIVYGPDSLLYIGETGQTFSQRFNNDHTVWLKEEEGVFIHVGRIVSEDYDDQVRKDAEALTIYWHSPAYNSSNIGTYNGQQLIVVNDGERGDLCEILSVVEDSSLVKVKYFLKVLEFDDDSDDVVQIVFSDDDHNSVVQSDVFEVTGKRHRILQNARNKALNNVRREDLRGLFEKQRWNNGPFSMNWREYYGETGYKAGLFIREAPEDEAITF